LFRRACLTSSSIRVRGVWCKWISTTARGSSRSGLKT